MRWKLCKILIHRVFKDRRIGSFSWFLRNLEQIIYDFVKMSQGIQWATLSLLGMEILISLRVSSLVRLKENIEFLEWAYILTGSASTATTCRRCAHFTVRSLSMFLLHMCVQCGVAKIRLVAVLALKIAAVNIVLGPPLVLVLSIASTSVFIRAISIPRLVLVIIMIWILLFGNLGSWGWGSRDTFYNSRVIIELTR